MLVVLKTILSLVVTIGMVEYMVYAVENKTNGTFMDWASYFIVCSIIIALFYIYVIG